MKIRKITAAVLAGVMIVLSGCGGNEETPDFEAERAEISEMSERLEAFSEELVSMSEEVAAGTAEDVTSEEVRESETTVETNETQMTETVLLSEITEHEKPLEETGITSDNDDRVYKKGEIPLVIEPFEYPDDPMTVENLMKLTMEAKLRIGKEERSKSYDKYQNPNVLRYGLVDADFDGLPELFCQYAVGSATRPTCRLYSLKEENFAEPLVEYLAHEDDENTCYYMHINDNGEKSLLVHMVFAVHSNQWGSTCTYEISHSDGMFSVVERFYESCVPKGKEEGGNIEIWYEPRRYYMNGEVVEKEVFEKEFKKYSINLVRPVVFMRENVKYSCFEGNDTLYERGYVDELYDIYDLYIKNTKFKK